MMSSSESGFTLIELMVVVLIIGILVAMALPTFLGARTRAQDSAAKASARNSLVVAKVEFTDSSSFVGLTPGTMSADEPSLVYLNDVTDSLGPNEVSVGVPDAFTFVGAVLSQSGTCWFIRDVNGVPGFAVEYNSSNCSASYGSAQAFTTAWP